MHVRTISYWYRASARRCCVGLSVVGLLSAVIGPALPARAQPTTTAPATPAPVAAPVHQVLEPTQGRPKFLTPGGVFHFVLRLQPNIGPTIFVDLVHSQLESVRHNLDHEGPLTVYQEQYGTLVLRVPHDVREGLYDLVVRGEGWVFRQPHCIQVIEQYTTRFRFVHLSDMNIDDPSAPEFDTMLPAEINILAPAFIVATGDFTDWGRMLDDPSGWPRVLAFFEKFDAPVFLVCGDHDHEESYTTYVANSPAGSFDYGNYHGILLLDHSAHRLGTNQIQWLRQDLADHRDSVFNFIVTHSDDLDFLDALADPAHLPAFIKEHKLAAVITGGHTDWDEREFAEKLVGLDGLHYIRTAQASTCLRDRASGVSHYRVIEVDGDRLSYIYPDDMAVEPAQHSIPVGRLKVFYDGPNDGSRRQVMATIQNALNQSFTNCRVWLRVAKGPDASEPPTVAGGRLVQALDGESFWLCDVRFDVPDKGGSRVMVSSEGKLPAPVPLAVSLDGARDLTFTVQRSPMGIKYYASSDELALRLDNPTDRSVEAWPVVRLNGNVVPIDEGHADRWPVRLDAHQSLRIPLRLTLGRVSEGEHLLQVYFLEDPLKRTTTIPVTLTLGEQATHNVPAPRRTPASTTDVARAPAATQPARTEIQGGK